MSARLKEGLRTAGFMFGLTLVVITCVSALQLATAERVNRNAALFLQRAVMEVAGVPVPEDPVAVGTWFRQAVEAEPAAAPVRFRVRDAETGAVRAMVHVRQGRGLWGLIITNCIVMGHTEAVALSSPPIPSLVDGFAAGVGYSYVLLLIAICRELLGTGAVWGVQVLGPHWVNWSIMVMAPGGFFVLAVFVWIVKGWCMPQAQKAQA